MSSKNFKNFVQELGYFADDIEDGVYTDTFPLKNQLFMFIDEYEEKIYTKKGIDTELQSIIEKASEAYAGKKSIDEIFDIVYNVWKEGYKVLYPKSEIFAD